MYSYLDGSTPVTLSFPGCFAGNKSQLQIILVSVWICYNLLPLTIVHLEVPYLLQYLLYLHFHYWMVLCVYLPYIAKAQDSFYTVSVEVVYPPHPLFVCFYKADSHATCVMTVSVTLPKMSYIGRQKTAWPLEEGEGGGFDIAISTASCNNVTG